MKHITKPIAILCTIIVVALVSIGCSSATPKKSSSTVTSMFAKSPTVVKQQPGFNIWSYN